MNNHYDPELIRQITDKCSLPSLRRVVGVNGGYRNKIITAELIDKRSVNIVFYKNEFGIYKKIKNANRVSTYLYLHDFPTRKAFSNSRGSDILFLSNGSVKKHLAVYNYLPGSTIPWESYTKEHIKLIGEMMSKMHQSLSANQIISSPNVLDEIELMFKRMEKYFSRDEVIKALESKLNLSVNLDFLHLHREVLNGLKHLEKTVLHMDFVRGNVLFSETGNLKITGVIDFEKVAYGPAVVDISRTLAFLLVDCKHKETIKIQKYFLYSGYQKRGGGAIKGKKYISPLLRIFWAYDLYKFLLHNPYESLLQNEHFVRTIQILRLGSLIHLTT